MIIRWILTIIAIVIFSWITGKIIKDNDLPVTEEKETGIRVNQNACMGCTLCTKNYPGLFEMKGKKSSIKEHDHIIVNMEELHATIEACPVNAIEYNEV